MEFRILLADLTMVYKIINHRTSLNPLAIFDFSLRPSRQHNLQLKSKYLGSKKHNSFTTRVINTWNVLKRETVNAKNLFDFKGKLIENLKNLQEENRLPNLYFKL